jgi:tetratricopeptide (TPR) repeat protein
MIAGLLLLALAFQEERTVDADLEQLLAAEVARWESAAELPAPDELAVLLAEAETLDAPRLFQSLGDLGHKLAQAGRKEEGRALVRWSGEQALAVGALATRSWALEWLGQEAWVSGALDEAAALLTEAATTDAQRGFAGDEARHRADVARLFMTLGRHADALVEIQRAEEAAARSRSDQAARLAAEAHASLLYDLGRHREALALCAAHAPLDALAPVPDESWVRLDLLAATILADVGRLETAVGYARRAHTLALDPAVLRLAPLLHLEAKLTFGLQLGDLGRVEEGLGLLRSAAREFKRQGDRRGAAWAEKNYGFVTLAALEFSTAARYLERAWTAGRELGVPFLEGIGALGTAEALDGSGGDEARIEEALGVAERVGEALADAQIRWRVAALRGRRALARDEPRNALPYLRAAVAGIEAWRRRLAADGLVEHALRARSDVYRDAARAAAESGAFEEACTYAGLLQARLLDERVARRDGPLAPAPSAELERLRARVAELELARGSELEEASAELDRALLAADLAAGRALAGVEQALPLAELRAGLAAEALDLALVFLVGARESLVLGIEAAPDRLPSVVRVALTREELSRDVARLRRPLELLEAGAVDLAHLDFDVALARRLHEQLVAPLELVEGTRIALLLDGDLHALPFEALVTGGALGNFDHERAGGHLDDLHFLGEAQAFVRVASLARLARPRAARAGETVVVRPPVALATGAAALDLVPGARLVAEAGSVEFERELTRAARLHLAAHGRLDPERPAHGWLLLGGADGRGAPFEAWRAADLALDGLELVLAACHSGRGAWYEGAGLVGLTGGFLAGGAREVVASLWAVGDGESARFLTRYHAERARGTDAPEALRRARVATRRESPHPFAWAAWIVQR